MPEDPPTPFEAAPARRDVRYCEIFAVKRHRLQLRGQVFNTLDLNDCPVAQSRSAQGGATR
jgi:hypothetical protein